MPVTDAPSADDAVRRYLTFLDDPSKLVDEAEVRRLQDQVDRAEDPIDRLLARAALLRAETTDGEAYKRDFIKHAKKWADAEGVPASAFRALGVPDDVLANARLDGKTRRGTRVNRDVGAPRRARISIPRLEEKILLLDGTFTVKDVTEQIGGSPATVKSALGRLEVQGKVKRAGERIGHRGRAAKAWEVVAAEGAPSIY